MSAPSPADEIAEYHRQRQALHVEQLELVGEIQSLKRTRKRLEARLAEIDDALAPTMFDD